jgi:hypothetical protein
MVMATLAGTAALTALVHVRWSDRVEVKAPAEQQRVKPKSTTDQAGDTRPSHCTACGSWISA